MAYCNKPLSLQFEVTLLMEIVLIKIILKSSQGDATTEHVGPPIACSAIKLCDVPELEYFASMGQVSRLSTIQEPILPNSIFLRFPIFAGKLECLLHMKKCISFKMTQLISKNRKNYSLANNKFCRIDSVRVGLRHFFIFRGRKK